MKFVSYFCCVSQNHLLPLHPIWVAKTVANETNNKYVWHHLIILKENTGKEK